MSTCQDGCSLRIIRQAPNLRVVRRQCNGPDRVCCHLRLFPSGNPQLPSLLGSAGWFLHQGASLGGLPQVAVNLSCPPPLPVRDKNPPVDLCGRIRVFLLSPGSWCEFLLKQPAEARCFRCKAYPSVSSTTFARVSTVRMHGNAVSGCLLHTGWGRVGQWWLGFFCLTTVPLPH